MDCTHSRKMLSAYLDGELRPEDRAGIDTHLASCQACSRILGELEDIKALFKVPGTLEAPYGFSTRVLAAAREERPVRTGWARRLIFAAEGFAVAVVVLAGIMTGGLISKAASPATGPGIVSQLSLDLFDAAPAGSMTAAYLAMTGVNDER